MFRSARFIVRNALQLEAFRPIRPTQSLLGNNSKFSSISTAPTINSPNNESTKEGKIPYMTDDKAKVIVENPASIGSYYHNLQYLGREVMYI
jgi:hypothetical protein